MQTVIYLFSMLFSVTDADRRKAASERASDATASVSDWTTLVAEWTSVHGIVWYTRTTNKCARILILIFALAIVFGLPAVLVLSFVRFIRDFKIQTSGDGTQRKYMVVYIVQCTTISILVEWEKAKTVEYPNITVCHPKYFSKKKLTGEYTQC